MSGHDTTGPPKRRRKKLRAEEREAQMKRRLGRLETKLKELINSQGLGINTFSAAAHGHTATITIQVRVPDHDEPLDKIPIPEGSTEELEQVKLDDPQSDGPQVPAPQARGRNNGKH